MYNDAQIANKSLIEQSKTAVENWMQVGDIIPIISYIRHIQNNQPAVSFASIVDMKNNTLAGFTRNPNYNISFPKSLSLPSIPLIGLDKHQIGQFYFIFDDNVIKSEINNSLAPTIKTILFVSGITLVFVILIAAIAGKKIVSPVLQISDAARKVAAGDMSIEVPVKGSDEVSFLTHEFNLMVEKLRTLDKMKDDFVSSVSHELRSPVGSIIGYADQIIDGHAGTTTQTQIEYMNIIKNCGVRLLSFVNSVLDIAKIKSGKFDMEKDTIRLDEIVSVAVLLITLQLKERHITVESRMSPVSLLADGENMMRVITNLLSNAYKYTPEGGHIVVSVSQSNKIARVSVKDNGAGIPEKYQQDIFNEFTQVKETKKYASSKGTGLGLALVKKIVELHKGRIWVESKMGSGSEFIMEIPISS